MGRSYLWFTTTLLSCVASSVSLFAEEPAPKTAPTYTATAILKISRTPPHLLASSAEKFDRAEFESYKLTQAELVKSPFVISAALRMVAPVLANHHSLPNLRQEENKHNAATWLGEKLRVKFPAPGSEIMKVSLTSSDAVEAAILVNAVAKAYFDEVVNVERLEKKQRYVELQNFAAESENALRTKRTELRQLAETLGVNEPDEPSYLRELQMQSVAQIQAELSRMRNEFITREHRTKELTLLRDQLPDEEIAESEWLTYPQQTDELKTLLQTKSNLEASIPFRTGPASQSQIDRRTAVEEQLKKISARIDEIRSTTITNLRVGKRLELDRELRRLISTRQIVVSEISELSAELETKTKALVEKSRPSIDLTMKQAEISRIEESLTTLNREMQRLRLDFKAPPRVSVCGDQNNPADVPESPDEPRKNESK